MSPMINGTNLTEACAKALVQLARTAIDVDEFDPRVPRNLAKAGLATVEDETVLITDKGRAIVAAHTEKAGGKPTPRAVKTTKPKRSVRKSPPPTGAVDFSTLAFLREQITTRYERDLAAVDRLIEIANAVTL